MRGRRPDAPEDQIAKGHPGRRRSKVARASERASEVAALLSVAPEDAGDPLGPPAQLRLPAMQAALAVWREYAPKLTRLNLLADTDRHTFFTFCVQVAEYVEAHQDVLQNGYSRLVKTTSGDKMPRVNPSVERRDQALKFILELSKRFGLSPIDRFNLLSSQRSVLGGQIVQAQRTNQAEQGQSELEVNSPIGALNDLDSPPPSHSH